MRAQMSTTTSAGRPTQYQKTASGSSRVCRTGFGLDKSTHPSLSARFTSPMSFVSRIETILLRSMSGFPLSGRQHKAAS